MQYFFQCSTQKSSDLLYGLQSTSSKCCSLSPARLQVKAKHSVAHTMEQERRLAAVAAEQDRLAARAE